MVITPRHASIARLFGLTRIFSVPKYQCHYAWTAEVVDDLKAFLGGSPKARKASQERADFFGGLATFARPHSGSETKLEIIDGQQHLATVVISIAQAINVMLEPSTKLFADVNGSSRKFLDVREASCASSSFDSTIPFHSKLKMSPYWSSQSQNACNLCCWFKGKIPPTPSGLPRSATRRG